MTDTERFVKSSAFLFRKVSTSLFGGHENDETSEATADAPTLSARSPTWMTRTVAISAPHAPCAA